MLTDAESLEKNKQMAIYELSTKELIKTIRIVHEETTTKIIVIGVKKRRLKTIQTVQKITSILSLWSLG